VRTIGEFDLLPCLSSSCVSEEGPGSFCVVPARPSTRITQVIARVSNIFSQQQQQSNAADWGQRGGVEAAQTDWRTEAPFFKNC
jgi:hypothetical protein